MQLEERNKERTFAMPPRFEAVHSNNNRHCAGNYIKKTMSEKHSEKPPGKSSG